MPGDRILHLGCGWDRSQITYGLRNRTEVIGLDEDSRPAHGYHSPYWRASAERLPFADAVFDLICSEYVFEHLAHPDRVMAELGRVLRPGGTLVALTPNRWSYKSLVAALTPHLFHQFAALYLRPDARKAADVYPTYYLLNSRVALLHTAAMHGLAVVELTMLNNGPTWFRRLPAVFELARIYHRLLDLSALSELRCGILIVMRKRDPYAELEAIAESNGERQPWMVRCVACATTGMNLSIDGYACPYCGHTYAVDGNFVETAPI